MTTVNTDDYTYRVRWSAEDEGFVGTVVEFPSLSWIAASQNEALVGLRPLVADVLTALEDADDVAAFDDAMTEEGSAIPWREVEANLGWA